MKVNIGRLYCKCGQLLAPALNLYLCTMVRLLFSFILSFGFQLAGANLFARTVDIKKTRILSLPQTPNYTFLSKEDQMRIAPKNISENESADSVLARMADSSVSLWWDTTPLRQSAIGKAADTVEKKMNVKVEIEDKNKIKHTMNLKILAMQALARLEYRGWVRAAISYDARAAKTEAEVSEDIGETQNIVITHTITSNENKSQLGWRWSW